MPRQARAPAHTQQHGMSYDISGFARTFRVASHAYRQATLTIHHPNGPPGKGPSHI